MLQQLHEVRRRSESVREFEQTEPSADSTVESIARYVERRCFGRVFQLEVERRGDDCVVIYGRTATYYAKQLAQHAVQEIVDGSLIDNRIEVVPR